MIKRILVQDYGGYAFPVQLSKALARRGYDVRHVFAGSNNMPNKPTEASQSDPIGYCVRSIETKHPLEKYNLIQRWFQEREYGQLVCDEVDSFLPDVVLSANMPLDAQKKLLRHCKKKGIRFIYWLQDLISVAANSILDQKLPVAGRLIGAYYTQLEFKLLAESDRIVAISPDFQRFLNAAAIPNEKVTIIPNWAELSQYTIPKDNPWSRANGCADKFCFTYTGTLGYKHKPEILLALALHFMDDPNVVVKVISIGPGASWLLAEQERLGLKNLQVIPYVAGEEYPLVLAASDVLVAILSEDASKYSVPSKVNTYLAAGKPLLLAMPPENRSARIVAECKSGFLVDAGDKNGFIQKAEALKKDRALRLEMGKNGQLFAEVNFEIEAIADKFNNIFEKTHIEGCTGLHITTH